MQVTDCVYFWLENSPPYEAGAASEKRGLVEVKQFYHPAIYAASS